MNLCSRVPIAVFLKRKIGSSPPLRSPLMGKVGRLLSQFHGGSEVNSAEPETSSVRPYYATDFAPHLITGYTGVIEAR